MTMRELSTVKTGRDFRMKYSVINPYRTRFIHRVLSRSCRKKSISSNRTVA